MIVMGLLDRPKAFLSGIILLVFIFIFLPSLNNVRHVRLINDNNGAAVQQKSHVQGIKPAQNVKSVPSIRSILEQGGSGRPVFWKNAVSIIRSSPICGTGLNTYLRVIKRNPDQKTWWYAHNCYLQLAAETGLLGLACFLWMLFVLLRHGFKLLYPDKGFLAADLASGNCVRVIWFFSPKFF